MSGSVARGHPAIQHTRAGAAVRAAFPAIGGPAGQRGPRRIAQSSMISASSRCLREALARGGRRRSPRAAGPGSRDFSGPGLRTRILIGRVTAPDVVAVSLVVSWSGNLARARDAQDRSRSAGPLSCSASARSPSSRHGSTAAPTGTRNVQDFVAAVPRSTRSRTYASPAASPRPGKACYQLGRLPPSAGRSSHPLDRIPRSLRTRLAWSQRFLRWARRRMLRYPREVRVSQWGLQ